MRPVNQRLFPLSLFPGHIGSDGIVQITFVIDDSPARAPYNRYIELYGCEPDCFGKFQIETKVPTNFTIHPSTEVNGMPVR